MGLNDDDVLNQWICTGGCGHTEWVHPQRWTDMWCRSRECGAKMVRTKLTGMIGCLTVWNEKEVSGETLLTVDPRLEVDSAIGSKDGKPEA